jgi:hypothetical protein
LGKRSAFARRNSRTNCNCDGNGNGYRYSDGNGNAKTYTIAKAAPDSGTAPIALRWGKILIRSLPASS